MPRGGARLGAGRKPSTDGTPSLQVIGGGVSDPEVSVIAPSDLGLVEREFWQAYAVDAMVAGTLTPRTISTFRFLCEVQARKQRAVQLLEKAEALTDQDGKSYLDALVKLHRVYMGLAMRTESLMARFGLAPAGKPIEGARKRNTPPNPWERVAGARTSE